MGTVFFRYQQLPRPGGIARDLLRQAMYQYVDRLSDTDPRKVAIPETITVDFVSLIRTH
jgi:hypothetical protein